MKVAAGASLVIRHRNRGKSTAACRRTSPTLGGSHDRLFRFRTPTILFDISLTQTICSAVTIDPSEVLGDPRAGGLTGSRLRCALLSKERKSVSELGSASVVDRRILRKALWVMA